VEDGDTHTLGARWVSLVTRVPVLTVVLVVAALAVLAVPAKDLALGLQDNGSAPPGSPERVTYDLVSDAYGAGYNAPLLVTVDIIRTTAPLGVMDRLGRDLGHLDGVEAVALSTPNPKADLGIVQIIPDAAQNDPVTADLVRAIRARADALEAEHGVDDLLVTGHTAIAIDVSERLAGALLPFGVVVVGLSLVLLAVVFRSVAVPVKATLGYLLSLTASFGAVAAVFEWGWLAEALNVSRVGPVIPFMPILLMGVLFGLAMDYEVFLVSRMREEFVRSGDARRAIHKGFTSSARVVTSAAVIMIAVFAAFVPNGDASVKPMALGMAVGVFADAFLVRMTLVPAVLTLLGDRAWWLPTWLDRRLPVLDVEGAGLEQHLEHEAWTRRNGTAAVRAEGVQILDEHGHPLVDAVSAVVRAGELLLVRTDDRVARRALLTAVAGRLDISSGRLVVLDRQLPGEAPSVRRRVQLFERFPPLAQLSRVGRRRAGAPELVVVDDVDVFASADELARRWDLLAALTTRGVAVLAGSSSATAFPGGPNPAVTTLSLSAGAVARPATEEASL
ncbi:MAG: MMPL family transporter, partial [Nocardioidaceae bacterium]